mmetsp:Transcript_22442/g.67185  ORF Transcript_22442/g.67185 Transcript_22442/m.67185 type:complete len:207 (-) Transcript_22442:148-768(-)
MDIEQFITAGGVRWAEKRRGREERGREGAHREDASRGQQAQMPRGQGEQRHRGAPGGAHQDPLVHAGEHHRQAAPAQDLHEHGGRDQVDEENGSDQDPARPPCHRVPDQRPIDRFATALVCRYRLRRPIQAPGDEHHRQATHRGHGEGHQRGRHEATDTEQGAHLKQGGSDDHRAQGRPRSPVACPGLAWLRGAGRNWRPALHSPA